MDVTADNKNHKRKLMSLKLQLKYVQVDMVAPTRTYFEKYKRSIDDMNKDGGLVCSFQTKSTINKYQFGWLSLHQLIFSWHNKFPTISVKKGKLTHLYNVLVNNLEQKTKSNHLLPLKINLARR